MSVDVSWDRADEDSGALTGQLESVADALLEAVGQGHRELSLVVTDSTRMTAHNRTWRGVEGPTDVLSFPMDEGDGLPAGLGPLGDVVIDLDTAEVQAASHGWTLEDEVVFLLIHGLCHLCGHDHSEPEEATLMKAEETRLLAIVAPGRARPDTSY